MSLVPQTYPHLLAGALQLVKAAVLGAAHDALVIIRVGIAGANHKPAQILEIIYSPLVCLMECQAQTEIHGLAAHLKQISS